MLEYDEPLHWVEIYFGEPFPIAKTTQIISKVTKKEDILNTAISHCLNAHGLEAPEAINIEKANYITHGVNGYEILEEDDYVRVYRKDKKIREIPRPQYKGQTLKLKMKGEN